MPGEVKCDVCDGTGFVRAAPLSQLPTNARGTATIGASHGLHRKALWSRAMAVPCWSCGGGAA